MIDSTERKEGEGNVMLRKNMEEEEGENRENRETKERVIDCRERKGRGKAVLEKKEGKERRKRRRKC